MRPNSNFVNLKRNHLLVEFHNIPSISSPLTEGKIIESCETLPYEKGQVVLFFQDKMKPVSNNQYLLDQKDILGIVSN